MPLIALQYHEVKINIDFERIENLLKYGSTAIGSTAAISGDLDASLWVDYIFLDTDERRRFAQLSHEYLIEQLQFTGDESITGLNERVKLNFNHPVKSLMWVVQRDAVLGLSASNDWTNYVTGDVAAASSINCVASAKLQLNGQDRFAQRDGTYFNLVQPFQHHENVSMNKGINVYSFALKPEEHQPSGTLNFSRIDTAVLQLALAAGVPSAKIKSFAINYNVLRIMSGMGGLNAQFRKLLTRTKKQQSTVKRALTVGNHFVCSKYTHQLLVFAAALSTPQMQHILLFGEPLTAFSTKVATERCYWPRVNNSGTVIMKRIGQSACLLPNGAMIANGRASETERIWVVLEGLINQKRLKIQSIPLGKFRGTRVPIPTRLSSKRIYTLQKRNSQIHQQYIFCDID